MSAKYCINPETNRNIRIGGKTWMRLVKTNKIDEGDYKHPNVAFATEETYEDSALEKVETQNIVQKQLEEQKQRMIAEGRVPTGKSLHIKPPKKGFRSRGKIVYRERNLTSQEATRNTANAAMDVIDQIQNSQIPIPADMSRDEAREYLQGLIFDQMLKSGKKFKNPKMEATKALKKPMKYKTIAPKKISARKKVAKKRAPRRPLENLYAEYADETETEYADDETEIETETETEYADDETEIEYVY